jgi:hypothetical protein
MKGLTIVEPTNRIDGWAVLRIENDIIGLSAFGKNIKVKLSKESIYQLRDYLTEFLNEEHANRYYLVNKNEKYLNIDSTEYIGFGEKEIRYKNTFTDNEIDEYNLSHWIENGNVKKILVENTNN